jgi:hypothetical protein
MSKFGTSARITGVAAAILACAVATATAEPARPTPSPASAAPAGWQIEVTSYGWFPSFRGDTATLPPLPAAHVDLGFGDILSKLDGALMGIVWARRDRLILWGDLMYSKLSVDERFSTPVSTSLALSSSTLVASGGLGWTVVDGPVWDLDLMAGARVYRVKTDARLSLPGYGITRSGGTDEVWADPMLGARAGVRLAERWYLTSWAFVGGFDVGSKVSWDAFGGVGWKFDDRYTLLVGYRGLGVDHERGGYVYDVVQQGPIVGVKAHF